MKKCSYCGRENDEASANCSECGTEFEGPTVSDVDPQLTDPGLSPVIVGTYRTIVEAGVIKLRLEAAGIEADIPEEYTPQIFWYAIPSPLERVTVRVPAKDYETARRILAAS